MRILLNDSSAAALAAPRACCTFFDIFRTLPPKRAAIKAAGGAVIVMAHRPAAIQECDMLLVIENGARRAFGPKDDVLREIVKNHDQITRSAGKSGGVS